MGGFYLFNLGIKRFPTSSLQNTITAIAGVIALTIIAATPNQSVFQIKDMDQKLTLEVMGNGTVNMSGALNLKGSLYNSCSSLANNGKLTVTSTGAVICANDVSGGGGAGVTATGAATQMAYFVAKNNLSGASLTQWFNSTRTLDINGTMSGQIVRALKNLTSSGSFEVANNALVKGVFSGASVYIASSLTGDGLVSCSNSVTSKLLWNSGTGQFSCGSDQNTTYTAGQGLTLTTTAFSTNSTLTGSSLKFGTMSGNSIKAQTSLASSGTLVVKGVTTLQGTATAPTPSASDNSTNIATTAYVTNAVTASNPAIAVQATTTKASDTSSLTYLNGVSGIGATFTGSNNTAITIDGFTFTTLGQRLLVKNDTQSPSGAFNGVYYVTQIQTAILPPILTRAIDYDQSSDINNTGAIPVVSGTVNASTSWLLTSSVTNVGVDPLTYVQFSYNPSTLVNKVGQGLGFSSGLITLNATITGSLVSFQTSSGRILRANVNLTSSGTMEVTNGALFKSVISGASLYVGSSFTGNGLVNCVSASSALQWASATGRFSCASISGSAVTAGQGLAGTTSFSVNATLTGTMLRFLTVSGSTLFAKSRLTSSGSLKILADMSGSTLHVNNMTSLSGSLSVQLNERIKGTDTIVGAFSGAQIQIQGLASYILGTVGLGRSAIAHAGDQVEVQGTFSGGLLIGSTISGSVLRVGSAPSPSCWSMELFASGSTVATGSGKLFFPFPYTMSGYSFTEAIATTMVSGTTNSTTIQLRNADKGNQKIFGTPVTITTGTTKSDNTRTFTNPLASANDRILVDIPAVSTTPPKVLDLQLCTKHP